jgi:hypothetical protein
MTRNIRIAALACAASLIHARPGFAHAVCGARVFPVTLTLDDPGVADELTLPQVQYQRSGADGGPGPTHETDLDFEYDKRLTENIGFAFNDGYNFYQTNNTKTEAGWQDAVLTAKWAKCIDPDDDFVLGLGVIREFGRSGTAHTGADQYGNTAPTVYLGKGLAEIPVPMLQPFQVTGEFSYAIADRGFKEMASFNPVTGVTGFTANAGYPNQWIGSASLQYSISYLQNQIKDFGLPEPIAHMVPLVEVNWVSAANGGGSAPTSWAMSVGAIYLRSWYQIGLEAVIPLNQAAGTNVGVIAQFHVFLDDLYPHGIGAPLLDWIR